MIEQKKEEKFLILQHMSDVNNIHVIDFNCYLKDRFVFNEKVGIDFFNFFHIEEFGCYGTLDKKEYKVGSKAGPFEISHVIDDIKLVDKTDFEFLNNLLRENENMNDDEKRELYKNNTFSSLYASFTFLNTPKGNLAFDLYNRGCLVLRPSIIFDHIFSLDLFIKNEDPYYYNYDR